MNIPNNSTFLLIGDSITDAGRDPLGEPTPWNRSTGLGTGYVAYTQALLDTFAPDSRIRVINRGISGNTIMDLESRWQEDVLDLKPDWLSVFIGINDVWRQFDSPLRREAHILPDHYERIYRELLTTTRPILKGLVLMSPYVVEANPADPLRKCMDAYGDIVRRIAGDFDAVFVDTQAAFDRLMRELPPTEIAWDRIHPGPTGHMAIARSLLDAMGFAWHGSSCD